jgi:hypothetical protein
VLIRISEKNQAAAGDTVHHRGVRFDPEKLHRFIVISAGQGGTYKAAVTHQRHTEYIHEKDGEASGQACGYYGKPLDTGNHGPQKHAQQNSQDSIQHDQPAMQLALNIRTGLIRI